MTVAVTNATRANLTGALRARHLEIVQAAVARAHAIADVAEVADPDYVDGLRAAVAAAIDYGIEAIELNGEDSPPIPAPLLHQARLAAGNRVSLDTVLRRYFAGFTVFGDFVMQEAGDAGSLPSSSLHRLLKAQAGQFDRLIASVSEEHSRALASRLREPEHRLADRIEHLLAGEPIDTSDLAYDFDCRHLGLVASGALAAEAIRELADRLDCRLLLVRRARHVWAWLGTHRRLDPVELQPHLPEYPPGQFTLAIGEPGESLYGWRLTHRQASAAMTVASRGSESPVRYADVALLASTLRDEVLLPSLRQLYLDPLDRERNGGQAARETLRAYFSADRNITSAAARLGLNRHTVASRLRAIEERIGRHLDSCAADLESALRLDELIGSRDRLAGGS